MVFIHLAFVLFKSFLNLPHPNPLLWQICIIYHHLINIIINMSYSSYLQIPQPQQLYQHPTHLISASSARSLIQISQVSPTHSDNRHVLFSFFHGRRRSISAPNNTSSNDSNLETHGNR